MKIIYILFLILCAFQGEISGSKENVLSRKKRFLIFPEGSSFQLVFCAAYPAVTLRDIIIWGSTAALAFELPQDPYSPFNHKADPLHRRQDSKHHIYYTDERGRILYKQEYKRKPIVNPAFAKRSINVDRKQMHASVSRPDFRDLDKNTIDFHRSSRTDLYEKIEVMLQGLGGNGRECLLKTLCLYRGTEHYPQGGFIEEILRAVFILPKSKKEELYYQEYDNAASSTDNCDVLYPDCPSVQSNLTTM